jgi:hypothetical protein
MVFEMIYNCRRATLLSIKKAEGKIAPFESLQLRYHLLFCDPCRRFIEQWKMLDRLPVVELPIFKLSEEARNRIQDNLKS